MSDEASSDGEAGADKGAREAHAGLSPTSLSPTSPLRLLFVIVPLLVIVAVGSNLLGLWTMPAQQGAREERQMKNVDRQGGDHAGDDHAGGAEGIGVLPPDVEALLSTDPPANAPQMPTEDAARATEAKFDARAVVALLPRADPQDGAATFKMCWACHTNEKGEPAIIGPNLWGVVGRPKAGEPGYRYSAALKAKGGTWSYADLAELIHNPRAFVPGTSMAFRGIEKNARIANLIAYLRTLADDPVALPE